MLELGPPRTPRAENMDPLVSSERSGAGQGDVEEEEDVKEFPGDLVAKRASGEGEGKSER